MISEGQNLVFKQSNDNGIYKSGEIINIYSWLTAPGSSDIFTLKICRDFIPGNCNSEFFSGDTNRIYYGIAKGPATVIFEGIAGSSSGSTGIIIDPDKYRPSTRRPADFNSFWEKEKSEMRALPLNVKSTPVLLSDPDYQCFDVEINCTGPKPARGYLAKPASAKPRCLPIVIYFHAAGVSGDWCRSKPEIALRYARMGRGAISFDLNAHGMLNGQSDEYYRDLEDNELKNYSQTGLENRETVYFRGMYLRLLRTIDYLTSQPEWDGRRLLVIGESQGGGQALAAAGLDHRVSAVIATVPAMCDWGGSLAGRKGSWPYPFDTGNDRQKMLEALPYYDVVHILKGSRAIIVAEIGLIDQSCPSSALFATLNQAKGKKIIFSVPYRAHHMEQQVYRETWQNNVNKPKEDFLIDYLK